MNDLKRDLPHFASTIHVSLFPTAFLLAALTDRTFAH
jgi:hypothetical protein